MTIQDNKVLIIGLDGATFDVIRPLAKEGYLPNLNKLMAEGSHTDLESTIPYITPAAWSSFMTGTLPEQHGVFDFLEFMPQTCSTRLANSQSIRGKTIWKLLSEKGKRVAVIHLPMTYPVYEINGIMVSGFDTPSLKTNFTYPAVLKKEILDILPDYNFHLATVTDYFHDSDFGTFLSQLKRSLELRHQLAKHLLGKEPWDIFMINFQDLDCLHHNVWHYIEYQGSDHMALQRKIAIIDFFTYMDSLVGDLLDKAQNRFSHTMVVSDHGAGPAYTTVHPNNLLKEWGFLSVCKDITDNKKKAILKFKEFARHIRGDNNKNTAHGYISFSKDLIDWENTSAYVPIADIAAFCYINRSGREKTGIVSDKDYLTLCNDIRNRFLNTNEPLSGKRAFKDVYIGADFFSNNNNPDLPDLILLPNDGFTVNKAFVPNRNYSVPMLTGTHKRNGVLIIKGDKIKYNYTDFQANIIDMAPTILHILDLPVPSNMDGRPLVDIFSFNEQQTKWEEADTTHQNTTEPRMDYKDDEKDQIEKRLKSLGYL
jgi:predicted AlkP superfamily phosphohydrolase/phosphomutase